MKISSYYIVIIYCNYIYRFTVKEFVKLINSYHKVYDALDEMSHKPMSL